jgi:hypothetical protein
MEADNVLRFVSLAAIPHEGRIKLSDGRLDWKVTCAESW